VCITLTSALLLCLYVTAQSYLPSSELSRIENVSLSDTNRHVENLDCQLIQGDSNMTGTICV
jgi:hypothetical protein